MSAPPERSLLPHPGALAASSQWHGVFVHNDLDLVTLGEWVKNFIVSPTEGDGACVLRLAILLNEKAREQGLSEQRQTEASSLRLHDDDVKPFDRETLLPFV